MLSSVRKRVIIPPYWPDYLFGLFFLAAGYMLDYWAAVANFKQRAFFNTDFIIGVSILLLIKTCVHYALSEKGITVRFLWLPIRRIKWDQLSHAEYIYKWATGSSYGSVRGQGIYVTLKGCPMFSPELDNPGLFTLKHPIGSFFIRFTPKHQKHYVDIFLHYYPDLDYQIGYESNLNKGEK